MQPRKLNLYRLSIGSRFQSSWRDVAVDRHSNVSQWMIPFAARHMAYMRVSAGVFSNERLNWPVWVISNFGPLLGRPVATKTQNIINHGLCEIRTSFRSVKFRSTIGGRPMWASYLLHFTNPSSLKEEFLSSKLFSNTNLGRSSEDFTPTNVVKVIDEPFCQEY